nr:hypothetical protein Iba_scaffold11862CG0010 [Ipomoea batatas]
MPLHLKGSFTLIAFLVTSFPLRSCDERSARNCETYNTRKKQQLDLLMDWGTRNCCHPSQKQLPLPPRFDSNLKAWANLQLDHVHPPQWPREFLQTSSPISVLDLLQLEQFDLPTP